MKKIVALLTVLLMTLMVVCAFADMPADGADTPAGGVAGGWTVAESTEISEDHIAVFEKATEGLLGADYEPIAYLGSQVVAGLNHCFLCKTTVVYPGAVPTLVLVYIYEKTDGSAEITHIADLDIAALSVPAEPAAE